MKIIVTIPAYNEERTIGRVLKGIFSVLRKEKHEFSVLVVDDGSSDRTPKIAKSLGAVLVSHPKNRGLAEAFKTEMKECLRRGADIIVHTDADGQYNEEDIPKLIKKIEEGYDLVLGSRFSGGIEKMPFIKRIGNIAFSKVISRIVKDKISDSQTGFRAFTRKVAEKIQITSTYTYTQEQIIRAHRMNFRVCEIPTYFKKRQGKTKSRLMKGPLDYALKAGVNLVRIYRDYEPLKFFGYTGSVFIAGGIAIGIWSVINLVRFGTVGGIPRVILATLLLLTGIQILLFGFFADMLKK